MTFSDNQDPTSAAFRAKVVGNSFIKQYYGEVLPNTPLELHRFYSEQSIFSHAEGSSEEEPVSGLANIKEKISQLDLADASVDLDFGSVDIQQSQSGGIILMVTGCIQFREQPPRQFAQTVFLSLQKQGGKMNYVVLNDIFRLLDTIPSVLQAAVDEAIKPLQSSNAITVPATPPSPATKSPAINPQSPQHLESTPPSTPITPRKEVNSPLAKSPVDQEVMAKTDKKSPAKSSPPKLPPHSPLKESPKGASPPANQWVSGWGTTGNGGGSEWGVTPSSTSPTVSGWGGTAQTSPKPAVSTWEKPSTWDNPPKAASGWSDTPESPSQKTSGWKEAPSSPVKVFSGWGIPPKSSPQKATEAPPPPPPALDKAPMNSPQKSSWASIVSKKVLEPAVNLPSSMSNTTDRAISGANTTYEPPSKSVQVKSNQPANGASANNSNVCILWVRNIHADSTESEIGAVFEKFGPITNVYYRPDRNFAFVTFSSANSVNSALAARDAQEELVLGGRKLKYERKTDARKEGDKGNIRRAPRGIPKNSKDAGKVLKEGDQTHIGESRGANKGGELGGRNKGKIGYSRDVRGSRPPQDGPSKQQQISA